MPAGPQVRTARRPGTGLGSNHPRGGRTCAGTWTGVGRTKGEQSHPPAAVVGVWRGSVTAHALPCARGCPTSLPSRVPRSRRPPRPHQLGPKFWKPWRGDGAPASGPQAECSAHLSPARHTASGSREATPRSRSGFGLQATSGGLALRLGPAPRITACPPSESRVARGLGMTTPKWSASILGLEFSLKLQNRGFSLPLQDRRILRSRCAFSIVNKNNEESLAVTARPWGSPMPKHLDQCGKKEKSRQLSEC